MNTQNLAVASHTSEKEIRQMLLAGAESVTRPVSARMEDVFVLVEGRLWQLTNCLKQGGWEQVSQTCIDQEYDDEGNELF